MADGLYALLAQCVAAAEDPESTSSSWQTTLDQLDTRIRRLTEASAAEPEVPTELGDDYRREIDTLSLENMALSEKLNKATAALERAKGAYREESRHNALLVQKLDVLEERLAGVLRKRVAG